MARMSTVQTNFTAGELSPKVMGRTDIARYQNAAKRLRNVLVNVYGGAERTPGTEMVAPVKDESARTRLIGFVYSRDVAYTLEFGEKYMRVYRARVGQVMDGAQPYEIATPFTLDDVWRMRFAQRDSTMFLTTGTMMPHMLQRAAETNWRLQPAPFSVLPFAEAGLSPALAATLSDAAVGSGRTLTAAGAVFMSGDVGRQVIAGPGIATITAFASATQVTVDVTAEFLSTSLASGDWTLADSPQVPLKPSAKGTTGQSITLTLTGLDGWRAGDVGSYVRVNRGLVLITGVTSPTVANGIVKADLDSDVEAPASSWTLEQSVWDAAKGYPAAVAINQQRLVLGGSMRDPNGVWGSRSGLYFDFTLGDEDTDGFFYALDGESNGIQHLASVRALIALTLGTEWTMVGGVEKPLTPTNVQAKDQSVYGTTDVRPARIGDELAYVQRAGTSLLAMAFNVASDSYQSQELSTLSEHLLAAGIQDMAFQQRPIPVLWCVCRDGSLATMTINRAEGVTAWTGQDTAGAFESVCVVPAGDYDEVWVTVRRTVAQQTRRYVERFTPRAYTHAAVFGSDPSGRATWQGLEHLEGMLVSIRADGTVQPQQVVQGGEITLARPAKVVEFGIPVIPMVELLRPEVATQSGTAQASQMSAHEIDVLFLETTGAEVNGQPVNLRQFGDNVLDMPPPINSGWDSVGALGWLKGEMDVSITQPDPMPFHVLAVVRKWSSND